MNEISPKRTLSVQRRQVAPVLFAALLLLGLAACAERTQDRSVAFRIDLRDQIADGSFDPSTDSIGIRGSARPLSWDSSIAATDENGDGFFEAAVIFSFKGTRLKVDYKFKADAGGMDDDGWEAGPDRRFAVGEDNLLIERAFNEPPPVVPPTFIQREALLADIDILARAFRQLHPGLYRYHDEASFEAAIASTKSEVRAETDLRTAYLLISRFVATVKCGHTYANFWNQTARVRQELFYAANKVPFTFRLIGNRMIITHGAGTSDTLREGMEVTAINGESVAEILEALGKLVKADGANDAKRQHDLQLTGFGEFEPFDVYYPLNYPPPDERYVLELTDLASGARVVTEEPGVTRRDRQRRLHKRYGAKERSFDELWEFEILNPETAYLRLGSFVTWKMELNWKKFLRESFVKLREQGIDNLIVDIRGNEGGSDDVNLELMKYLIGEQIDIERRRELFRYSKVPEDLLPYAKTWDDSFFDRSKRVVPAENGFYVARKANDKPLKIRPGKNAFEGKLYLLVDAANSSATFYLGQVLKDYNLATLVGQETGGNQQGMNGGQLFFFRLPNSGIEVDIPLIGYYPREVKPDGGVVPDVVVEPGIEAVLGKIDAEREAALKLIAQRKQAALQQ